MGKTLKELDFWQRTHATVIAVRRNGSIILSPGPDMYLEPSDSLVLVGDQHLRPLVEELLS
ncbi:MAG: TrkA C-terminal domain-containing protein [Sphaerochaetaceae bacterium]|nr:TrkA C-terminal domain-containing protein [Sphaerochaetaceae bacterium]